MRTPDATTPYTLMLQSHDARATASPSVGNIVTFGRSQRCAQRPNHLQVGASDLKVSRVAGELAFREQRWFLRTLGDRPIRYSRFQWLDHDGDPVPLEVARQVQLLVNADDRVHAINLYVVGPGGDSPRPLAEHVTQGPLRWPLTDEERLVLTALAERYLRQEAHPQPLARQQAADLLNEIQDEQRWTASRVSHCVEAVRQQLSTAGVLGLTKQEVGDPVGNVITENLLRELLLSTTLTSRDLDRLDDPSDR